MDIDTISAQIIALACNSVIITVSGCLGYVSGILKERNSTKWKDNREALQRSYAYFDVLASRIKNNDPIPNSLFLQLEDLKYNKNYNISNPKLYNKIRSLLEAPIYDVNLHQYNEDIIDQFISDIDTLLPILREEMEKVIFYSRDRQW